MSNPTARAIATGVVSAACAAIAWAAPIFGIFALAGLVGAVYLIWRNA